MQTNRENNDGDKEIMEERTNKQARTLRNQNKENRQQTLKNK